MRTTTTENRLLHSTDAGNFSHSDKLFLVVINPMKYNLFNKSSVIFIRNLSALSSFFNFDANFVMIPHTRLYPDILLLIYGSVS